MGSVLLFQAGPLGDSLFTAALSDIIKKEKPQMKVVMYTSPAAAEMLKDNNNIDSYIFHTGNFLKDIKNLRKENFSFLIDTWATGDAFYRVIFSRASHKISFKKKKVDELRVPLIYSHQIRYKNYGYVFWDRIQLLKALGINVSKYIGKELPSFKVSSENIQKSLKILHDLGIKKDNFFLITPVGKWRTKTIPPKLVKEIAEKLHQKYNLPIVLASHPSDKNMLNEIKSLANYPYLHIVTTESLRIFAGLIALSKHLISVESLPYHIAVGLRKTSTVILGGFPIWKPPNYSKLNFVNIDMECKFCSSKTCKKGNYECLNKISSLDVINKVDELLQ